MKPESKPRLTLYSYWRSSAAYRVRIALNLKGLEYTQIPVHLVRSGGEQHGEEFRSVNSQGLVPVLLDHDQVITQSMAICEYLEECFPGYPLLPPEPMDRARVRAMALQVACEIHPLNNLRVQKYLKSQCSDRFDSFAWMSHWMTEGFTPIEHQLQTGVIPTGSAGLFECFLVPQVYNAERYGVDLEAFPRIRELVANCRVLPAFIHAAPENQADAEAV